MVESIMRLSVIGPAPIKNDIDEVGLLGGIGSQRRPKYNEMPIRAPLPPRDHQNKREFPVALRWTIVHEPASPHKNAVHYGGTPFNEQDLDLGPTIWRCALCEYQWYIVDDLERRDEGIVCPHCNLPLSKFNRPYWYRAPVE